MGDFYCNDDLRRQQQEHRLLEQGEGAKDRSQGVGGTDCCTTYHVDRGDKLAGTCAPNNQTLNATAGSPGLRFSFADGHGGVFDAQMDPACVAMLAGGATDSVRRTEIRGSRSNSNGGSSDGTHDRAISSHFIGIVVDAGPELVSWVV